MYVGTRLQWQSLYGNCNSSNKYKYFNVFFKRSFLRGLIPVGILNCMSFFWLWACFSYVLLVSNQVVRFIRVSTCYSNTCSSHGKYLWVASVSVSLSASEVTIWKGRLTESGVWSSEYIQYLRIKENSTNLKNSDIVHCMYSSDVVWKDSY